MQGAAVHLHFFSVVACLLADTCKGKGGENEISVHGIGVCGFR